MVCGINRGSTKEPPTHRPPLTAQHEKPEKYELEWAPTANHTSIFNDLPYWHQNQHEQGTGK